MSSVLIRKRGGGREVLLPPAVVCLGCLNTAAPEGEDRVPVAQKSHWEEEEVEEGKRVRGEVFAGTLQAYTCFPRPAWHSQRREHKSSVAWEGRRVSVLSLSLSCLHWVLVRFSGDSDRKMPSPLLAQLGNRQWGSFKEARRLNQLQVCAPPVTPRKYTEVQLHAVSGCCREVCGA